MGGGDFVGAKILLVSSGLFFFVISFYCGLDGLADELQVQDNAHAQRMTHRAVLKLALHAILVPVLRHGESDDERVRVGALDENRPAAVSRKRGEIGKKRRVTTHR